MSFEQGVTLLALFVGPAGIWFGWWLSERSTDRRAVRHSAEVRLQQETDRVLSIVRLAQRVEADGRSVAHALYLRGQGYDVEQDQILQMFASFNENRHELNARVAEARILGPSWLVEAAADLTERGQALVTRLTRLQGSWATEDVATIEADLPKMQAAAGALAELAASRLRSS